MGCCGVGQRLYENVYCPADVMEEVLFFVLEWLGGKRISDHRACDVSPLFRFTSKIGRQD